MGALTPWQNFYVILGSAAGALVGIQFVVIALIASRRQRVESNAIGAFGTPTVVHLGSALALSAVMTAPWLSLAGPSIVLVFGGIGALLYTAVVFRRARRQTDYQPITEDWVWYVVLPAVAYGLISLGAAILQRAPQAGLFLLGGTGLSLLLVALRNAWDAVTHIVSTAESDG